MQRSSESVAAIATALAKAQTELSNPEKAMCGATYVERPYQASAFFRHFIQQERCGHMSGLSARS
jgi:hypothetical protein